MKIVAISDTHTKHKKVTIPECDVLIHAGDFTWKGTYWEIFRFMKWFAKQPAKHKIVIAGNHELTLDATKPGKFSQHNWDTMRSYADENVHYLEDSEVVIDGVKFYGTPWTPFFHDWAFNGSDGLTQPDGTRKLVDVYSKIPEDTNVLICHGPTYDFVDKATDDNRCGSVEMRKILETDKLALLRLYISGHIHESRGHDIGCGGVHFCNVSTLGRDYETATPPVIIDLDENGQVDRIQGYNND